MRDRNGRCGARGGLCGAAPDCAERALRNDVAPMGLMMWGFAPMMLTASGQMMCRAPRGNERDQWNTSSGVSRHLTRSPSHRCGMSRRHPLPLARLVTSLQTNCARCGSSREPPNRASTIRGTPCRDADPYRSRDWLHLCKLTAPALLSGGRRQMQNPRLRPEGEYTFVEREQTRIGKQIE